MNLGAEIKTPKSALHYKNLPELPLGRTTALLVRCLKYQEYLKNPLITVPNFILVLLKVIESFTVHGNHC